MPSGIIPKAANFIPVMGGVSSVSDTGASAKPFQYDPSSRGLTVHIVGSDVSSSGGTSTADDADFVDGTTAGTIIQGVYESTPTTVTDGDVGAVGITQTRLLKVSIGEDTVGIGGGTQYTEDVAAAADPVGNALMITRDDQLSTVTEAEGDWSRARGTSKGALWVALADSSGDPITSFGGGTQYTEDAAAAANPVGTALNLIRADALAALTTTDGDNVAARGTDKGELYVKHADAMAVTNAGLTELAAAINASSQMDVNIAASGATVPVSHAALTELAAAIDTELQVDVVGALPAGTNAIGKLAANSGVDIGDVDITSIAAGDNNIGNVDILTIAAGNNNIGDVDVASIAAGNNNIGDVDAIQSGTWTVQPGNTANTTAWLVSPRPATAGGLTIFRSLDLDETEEDVKTSAGQVYGWYFANLATTPRYLKFYNATAANVTVGSTTPVLTFPIPANSTNFVAANSFSDQGIEFGTAITVAATTGLADNDTGAPGAGEVVVNIFYK
jgi:hypothetical protein